MPGIFNEYLSLVGTCHIIQTVHLCSIAHSSVTPLTVGNCEKLHESPVFVCLSGLDLLHSDISFILDKQTSDLCVNNQCHLVHQVAQYMSCVNAMTVTWSTSGKCTGRLCV